MKKDNQEYGMLLSKCVLLLLTQGSGIIVMIWVIARTFYTYIYWRILMTCTTFPTHVSGVDINNLSQI